MYAAFCQDVNLSPAVQPQALVYACFGEVVVVVASEETFYTCGVRQCEYWCVEVHGQTALLRIYECLTRSISQFNACFGCPEFSLSDHGVFHADHRQRLEEKVAAGFVLFCLQAYGRSESPFLFTFERELLAVVEHHFFNLSPFQSREHVILVGVHEFV